MSEAMIGSDLRSNQPARSRRWRGSALWALWLAGLLGAIAVAGCKNNSSGADTSPFLPDGAIGSTCDAEPNHFQPLDLSLKAQDDAGTRANLFSLWGADEKAIWAVGSGGAVLHYDGTAWRREQTPTEVQLTSVWGTSPKDVWAVGYEGVVVHYDGTAWSAVPIADESFVDDVPDGGLPTGDAGQNWRRNLWGVWARGVDDETTDLYAVGDRGTILYWSGKDKLWTKVRTDVEEKLSAVWGTSTRIFAAGDFGTVLVGSATEGFQPQQTFVNKALRAVWGRGANDVFAVGLAGTILHFNGTKWSAAPTGEGGAPPQVLRGIWGPPGQNVTYIVGWDGILMRMVGRPPQVTFDLFNCVSANRLEGIWGTMVPGPPPDGGMPDLGGADMSIPMVPALWIAGVSETLIAGP